MQKSNKADCACRIVAVGLSPTLDNNEFPPALPNWKDLGVIITHILETREPKPSEIVDLEPHHVLSRVGDRPTATILHTQLNFVFFAWVFMAEYSTKICSS